MSDVKDRFRSLDRIPTPDLWRDIERREPADLSLGPSWRRVGVVALAFVVAAAGIGVAGWAFLGRHEPRRLTHPAPIAPKANGQIAFLGWVQHYELFVMDADGRHPRQLTHEGGGLHHLDWSPDGRRLVLVSGTGDAGGPTFIVVAGADGSGLTQITSGTILDNAPDWSPDGRSIVFQRGAYSSTGRFDGDYDLYTMRPDGSDIRPLLRLPGSQAEPDWSPDGQRIVFAASPPGSHTDDLFVVSADGRQMKPLMETESADESDPQWSPDGSRIVFVRRAGRDQPVSITIVDSDGTNQRDLYRCVEPCKGVVTDIVWSPDGSSIAFSSFHSTSHGNRQDVYVMSADGSHLRRLTRSVQGCCPAWQPVPIRTPKPIQPGATITNGEIWYFNGNEAGAGVYRVEPDGTGQELLFADARNPSVPEDKVHPEAVAESMDWSPDGSRVVFMHGSEGELGQGGHWDIYVMNADGTDVTRLTEGGGAASDPAWSPDGGRIAYAQTGPGWLEPGCWGSQLCPSDIYVMNADGSGQARLTDDPADDSQPDWSPDGSQIVFKSDRGGSPDIYVMRADGTGVTSLSTGLAFAADPKWSPDGEAIAFIGWDEGRHTNLYLMNPDGSGLHQFTDFNDNSFAGDVEWSPDGMEIAATTDPGEQLGVYVVNIDGSGLHEVIASEAGDLAWRPVPA